MKLSLRRLVNERAEHCCEYCGLPKALVPAVAFHVEHIVPTGRATVRVFSINLPHRIRIRQRLIDAGLFPD